MGALHAVTLDRVQADLYNPDRANAQTVEVMAAHVHRTAKDPVVWAHAKDAVAKWGRGRRGSRAVMWAAWWWAKYHIRFTHHEDMLRVWLNETDQLQLLVPPDVLVKLVPLGDCAIFSMLVATFLEIFGVPWEFVTVKANPEAPSLYSHVYVRGITEDGVHVGLDASHGKYPGWEVPPAHRFGTQAWDGQARPVPDQGSQYRGLGQYRRRGFRGLGQDPTDTGIVPLPLDTNPGGVYGGQATFPVQPIYSTPSPTAGFNWSQTIANLLNAGVNLAGRVVAPTTTYTVGPNGQVTYTTPGSAPPPGAILPSGGSSSLLMWGGLALVAVLVVSSLGKR
jgi:hypothetical protein